MECLLRLWLPKRSHRLEEVVRRLEVLREVVGPPPVVATSWDSPSPESRGSLEAPQLQGVHAIRLVEEELLQGKEPRLFLASRSWGHHQYLELVQRRQSGLSQPEAMDPPALVPLVVLASDRVAEQVGHLGSLTVEPGSGQKGS